MLGITAASGRVAVNENAQAIQGRVTVVPHTGRTSLLSKLAF